MWCFFDSYFVKGFLVGISIAAPIGPVAIFCIRQTLTFGILAGLTAGFAVSIADGIYSWLAAYSTSLIERFIQTYAIWIYLIGGSFLIFLGIAVFRSPQIRPDGPDIKHRNLLKSFYRTLLLTFASPMTTLLFIGMFTAYGIFEVQLKENSLIHLVTGVFFGALTWWIILAFFVGLVQKHANVKFFRYVNYVSGSLITGYGLIMIYKFLSLFLLS